MNRFPSQAPLEQFEKKLQYFAHRISIITALETGGKLSPGQAFDMMESLWVNLESTGDEAFLAISYDYEGGES
ncbi:hypothetical protein L1047_10860 [Synechococcus sp. Nb3U1]|uniref:DUF7219 family protein n=1 Tax=Synechococcus sp. Nb3U1 TaxID=1914529 RepID=UPI001F3A302C|nr:hypothetical protein [Synechococcus sp. Nb3U1]MCF2971693.1 hypothetical protein [Synechococcus sp. Nb3U1]